MVKEAVARAAASLHAELSRVEGFRDALTARGIAIDEDTVSFTEHQAMYGLLHRLTSMPRSIVKRYLSWQYCSSVVRNWRRTNIRHTEAPSTPTSSHGSWSSSTSISCVSTAAFPRH